MRERINHTRHRLTIEFKRNNYYMARFPTGIMLLLTDDMICGLFMIELPMFGFK